MTSNLLVVGVAFVALLLANALWDWADRRRTRVRLRAEWGRSLERNRDMAAIASYHQACAASDPDGSIDDRTWRDLDMDAVFTVLDRTSGSVGQQGLYHRLRSRASITTLAAFDSIVSTVRSLTAVRERCQAALANLRGPAGCQLWRLAQPGAIDVRAQDFVSPLLAVAVLATIAMWGRTPPLAAIVMLLLLAVVVRAMNFRRVHAVIEPFRLLGPLVAAGFVVQSLHRAGHAPLTESLLTDLPQLGRLGHIANWLTRDSASLDPITGTLVELISFLLALDGIALLFGAFELRKHGSALARVLASVGDVDAAIAIASFRAGTPGWTTPCFGEPGSSLAIEGLRHPLLSNGTPNSIQAAPPHGVLITGSNMSGKSTLLRSVGVAVIMSQTIGTCLATAYSGPILCVRSCMGRSDDLVAGRSYYLDEVRGIVSLLRASESRSQHLFLLDEVFRGTNAVERIAAGEAALSELVSTPTRHVVLAATHDLELVSFLTASYSSYHMADRMHEGELVFEYRLTPGPGTSRNAIALLERHGAPSSVIGRALSRARELDDARRA